MSLHLDDIVNENDQVKVKEVDVKENTKELKEEVSTQKEDIEKPHVIGLDLAKQKEEETAEVEPITKKRGVIPTGYNPYKEEDKSEEKKLSIDMEDFSELEEDATEKNDEPIKSESTKEEDKTIKTKTTENVETLDEDSEFKNLQEEIKNNVVIFDKIKAKEFSIDDKPINYSNTVKSKQISTIADWVLYNDNRLISMVEFEGYELNNIISEDNSRSLVNRYRDIFTIIYNHVNSAKPSKMEDWLDSIKWNSMDDIYFSIYKGSYAKANHLPYKCPFCGKQYVAKDIPMERMYRFKNDKVKNKVESILASGDSGDINKTVFLKQVSDEYMIAFKYPSLFNITLEPLVLKEDFRKKYVTLLDNISYIDNIYFIERKTKKLRPIQLKEFPESKQKTLKEKVLKYSMILNSLTGDQYAYFTSITSKLDNDLAGDIEYILPGTECPNCHKKSKDEVITAQQLLFTRHQLIPLAII